MRENKETTVNSLAAKHCSLLFSINKKMASPSTETENVISSFFMQSALNSSVNSLLLLVRHASLCVVAFVYPDLFDRINKEKNLVGWEHS